MSLAARDLKHIWHPCTQMKEHEWRPLQEIVAAEGCYLHLKDGRKLFDSISSWWCKSLGHAHPGLKRALKAQLEKFEHVILAGTTHETIVRLSEQLSLLMPSLNKVFYASEGSSAVEIAMKMSLQSRYLCHEKNRTQFLALQNGYHGETLGALSVSDVGLYRDPFASVLLPVHFISHVPYVTGTDDLLWNNCESHWYDVEKELECHADTTTALIVEPIVQGAAGMKIYSADFLKRLREWTTKHNIHLIADEIMTGCARTGKMLACEHANITPDFLCLSKSLTSGFLPLSAVLTSQAIYDVFYDDDHARGFLHSHTQSGNALAASVAVETLRIMQEEKSVAKANELGAFMRSQLEMMASEINCLTHVRSIGAIAAADICFPFDRKAHGELTSRAAELGVFLRPLGNVIYWLPPLVANENDLFYLARVTQTVLHEVLY